VDRSPRAYLPATDRLGLIEGRADPAVDFTSGEPMDAPVAGPPKVEHGSLLPARYRRSLEARPPKR
jgi:hypothetical protein